jgi:uncharacterized protein (TIGR02271 family)
MLANQDARDLIGRTAYASDGDKIGDIGQVYLNDRTGQPEFMTVKTGFLGGNENFVPIADATETSDGVAVPYDKDKVKNAPSVAADGHISEDEELAIWDYYGLSESGTETSRGTTGHVTGAGDVAPTGQQTSGSAAGDVAPAGHDISGPETDDAMTRSEEQLNVGTQQREAGRVRLRKWVETENVTTTVPVSKEKAVLEREPVTEGNVDAAVDGPSISDEEHEVVLHEERPVVEKTTEPVERVRVGKETVTDEETVSEEVRKEQIDVDGDPEVR